jgi:hypothetical protein
MSAKPAVAMMRPPRYKGCMDPDGLIRADARQQAADAARERGRSGGTG